MTEYAQRQRQTRTTEDEVESTEAADLANAELDEDVSCCLADIDAALGAHDDADSEALAIRLARDREAAEQDYYANYSKRKAAAWTEKYAHLGAVMRDGFCCEYPDFDD